MIFKNLLEQPSSNLLHFTRRPGDEIGNLNLI